ncbi:MAG: carboxylase [Thiotrichales bacterium]|nr:carboxylase [Thiotrichales bacterium]
MSRRLKIYDTTLRDGHQCLWATRMPTSMMLPVIEAFDRAGYGAIELMGNVHFDACVRYLRDDPFERMREVKKRLVNTPMQGFIRSACVLGFDIKPADINRLWVEVLLRNGTDRMLAFDGLHDFDNTAPYLKHAKELGAYTVHWLIFSDSPVHTDEMYVAKAHEIIERADVDEIIIQDTSGVLTPERAATLVPALKAAVGDRPLGLHSHCLVGLPQRTYLEAAKHGIDGLYTCISPVADGNAPPSVQTTARNLRYAGYELDIDDDAIESISRHLEAGITLLGKPAGRPQDFDLGQFDHQIPGGVMSNLIANLEQAGMADQLLAVLEECGRVRAELGWPIMVTPFSQHVAVQAALNVIHGERYGVVIDEVKLYALGYFGKLLAPVEPNVLDRIIERGSQAIALDPPEPEPGVARLRERYPDLDDEERMLRYSFPEDVIDDLYAHPGDALPSTMSVPFLHLMDRLRDQNIPNRIAAGSGDIDVELGFHGAGQKGAA